ncbi:MAG: GNAT family N-acetyltransferase [Caldisericia bacterium]|nr:GNAT family N-acetyltransferase [Caldisericia bacterium]
MHIETKRLLIRNFQEKDWKDIVSYCSDAKTMFYIPMGVLNVQEVKEFTSSNPEEETECYAIENKLFQRVIGQIIYHQWCMERTWEIGWIINPKFQNKGYASEAAKAILNFGFTIQKLHRIIATCQPENLSSWKVAEKIGMRREGYSKKCIYKKNNAWWDEYFYAVLKEEY